MLLVLVDFESKLLKISQHQLLAFYIVAGTSAGKESACNAGDPGLIPGSGRSPGEGVGYHLQYSWASLVAQMVNHLPAMWETWVQSLGLGRSPGGGDGNLLQYSCLENLHGQRSLASYSPWGHRESNMTERLNTARTHTHTHTPIFSVFFIAR